MASTFQEQLAGELAGIDSANLRRTLREVDSPQGARVRLEGREVLNFSSNDYRSTQFGYRISVIGFRLSVIGYR